MFSEIRCLFGNGLLGVDDHVDDPPLPVVGHAAEIRLVAHLEVEIVELVQLGDELPDVSASWIACRSPFLSRL